MTDCLPVCSVRGWGRRTGSCLQLTFWAVDEEAAETRLESVLGSGLGFIPAHCGIAATTTGTATETSGSKVRRVRRTLFSSSVAHPACTKGWFSAALANSPRLDLHEGTRSKSSDAFRQHLSISISKCKVILEWETLLYFQFCGRENFKAFANDTLHPVDNSIAIKALGQLRLTCIQQFRVLIFISNELLRLLILSAHRA